MQPPVMIPLSSIVQSKNPARDSICRLTVQNYCDAMLAGATLPPITVFLDPDTALHHLADGWHRFLAAERLGNYAILATVLPGCHGSTATAAAYFAAGANQTHGLARSNPDKHAAARTAVITRPDLSDRALAQHTGLSHPFIAKVRAEIAAIAPPGASEPPATQRTGLDGITRTLPAATPPTPIESAPPPPADPAPPVSSVSSVSSVPPAPPSASSIPPPPDFRPPESVPLDPAVPDHYRRAIDITIQTILEVISTDDLPSYLIYPTDRHEYLRKWVSDTYRHILRHTKRLETLALDLATIPASLSTTPQPQGEPPPPTKPRP